MTAGIPQRILDHIVENSLQSLLITHNGNCPLRQLKLHPQMPLLKLRVIGQHSFPNQAGNLHWLLFQAHIGPFQPGQIIKITDQPLQIATLSLHHRQSFSVLPGKPAVVHQFQIPQYGSQRGAQVMADIFNLLLQLSLLLLPDDPLSLMKLYIAVNLLKQLLRFPGGRSGKQDTILLRALQNCLQIRPGLLYTFFQHPISYCQVKSHKHHSYGNSHSKPHMISPI